MWLQIAMHPGLRTLIENEIATYNTQIFLLHEAKKITRQTISW